jgi:hypothetical protein
MQSAAIASPSPSVATNHARCAGVTAATQPRTVADACDLCGAVASNGDVLHFAWGKLWCPECWAGREPAAAMVPTPRERQLLIAWIRPLNKGVSP